MELQHDFGQITNVEVKTSKTGKTYWDYELNGKKYRSWNDLELKYRDKGRLTYKPATGNYPPNAVGFILGDGVEPQQDKPVVEEVEDNVVSGSAPQKTVNSFEDKRKREIQIAQSCNLAQKHLFNSSYNTEMFDVLFKAEVKRYFKLLQELQQELL